MEKTDKIIKAQSDTAAILAESSAKGFIVDPEILQNKIDAFTEDVANQETAVREMIRKLMNWE